MEVTGSGTENPAGVTADKFYTPTDPGIKVNVYSGDLSSYKVPGPALFSGAGSGSSGSGSKSSAASPSATSAPAATSSVAVKNNAASTPVASSAPTSTGSSDSSLPETFTLDVSIIASFVSDIVD